VATGDGRVDATTNGVRLATGGDTADVGRLATVDNGHRRVAVVATTLYVRPSNCGRKSLSAAHRQRASASNETGMRKAAVSGQTQRTQRKDRKTANASI